MSDTRELAIETPSFPSLREIEAAGCAKLTEMAREYLQGGAGEEVTLRRNVAAFAEIRLRPRVMRDVSALDTRVTLFGREHRTPIVLAPTGYHRLFHPEGECESARGAAAAGVTLVVSSVATTALDVVARTNAAPRWYQIYCQRDRAWTAAQAKIAAESGYEALVLTVDTPVLGARDREKRVRFQLPEGLAMPNFPALRGGYGPNDHHDPNSVFNPYLDPSLTWKDLEWLREQTPLPVMVKGVLTPEDALLAVEHGAAGVLVSNHGGRNLDTVPAAIEALPAVARAVGERVPVLMDGGIRRGTDIAKALALGARAVLIGRPFLWGLAADGAAGVARVVQILDHELQGAMALLGVTSLAGLDGDVLWRG